jgi:hypothetical protein
VSRCCPSVRASHCPAAANTSSRRVSRHQSLRAVSASRLPDRVGRPCYPVCVSQYASCPSQRASPATISASLRLPVRVSSRLPISASRGVSFIGISSRHRVLHAVRGVHAVEPYVESERRSDFVLHQVGALECPATVSLVRVVRGLNTPETWSVRHVRLRASPEVSTPHEGHVQVGADHRQLRDALGLESHAHTRGVEGLREWNLLCENLTR